MFLTKFNLRRILENGHPITGAYSTNAATAKQQLHTQNISSLESISSASLLAWSATNRRLRNISDAKDGTVFNQSLPIVVGGLEVTHDLVQDLATSAHLLMTRDATELDLNLPDRQLLLGALVIGGVLSQEDSDSLYALATKLSSHVEVIGWPELPISLVIEALANPTSSLQLRAGSKAALITTTEYGPQEKVLYDTLPEAWAAISALHPKDGYFLFDLEQPIGSDSSLPIDGKESEWPTFEADQ